jgi:probable F420-dependent oxidoreductase
VVREALPPRSIGIWSRELRHGERGERLEAAAELDELGFAAAWIPGGDDDHELEVVASALAATSRITVATGILNIWAHEPAAVGAAQRRFDESHPGRFVLGLGVSHAPIVDADEPGRYRAPLQAMASFLDAFDAAGGSQQRVIAALAPKMLELASRRSAGIHPYLVPVEHTRYAREAVGADAVVAPELSVVLETDVSHARERARADLSLYLGLPNYVRTWRRLGFDDADLSGGGSDRLIDALYAHGSLDAVAHRIEEHFAAGADHVCLRVVTNAPMTGTDEAVPRAEWRRLAQIVSTFG